jgi:hypothetical protein
VWAQGADGERIARDRERFAAVAKAIGAEAFPFQADAIATAAVENRFGREPIPTAAVDDHFGRGTFSTAAEQSSTAAERWFTAAVNHSTAAVNHSTAAVDYSTAVVDHLTAAVNNSTAAIHSLTAAIHHVTAPEPWPSVAVNGAPRAARNRSGSPWLCRRCCVSLPTVLNRSRRRGHPTDLLGSFQLARCPATWARSRRRAAAGERGAWVKIWLIRSRAFTVSPTPW